MIIMFFNTPFSWDSSLYLTLHTCADKSSIAELDKKDNVVILNPDYIISSYHILIGVNRAFYNITMKKTKSKLIKKEIIHCMTNETKLDESLHLHSIVNNTDGNYYVIFINYKPFLIGCKVKISRSAVPSVPSSPAWTAP